MTLDNSADMVYEQARYLAEDADIDERLRATLYYVEDMDLSDIEELLLNRFLYITEDEARLNYRELLRNCGTDPDELLERDPTRYCCEFNDWVDGLYKEGAVPKYGNDQWTAYDD